MDHLGWWGACLRLAGACMFNIASISNFVNQTGHVFMSEALQVLNPSPGDISLSLYMCGSA